MSRQTKAIIKIVVWTIVFVLLFQILTGVLRGNWSGVQFGVSSYTYEDADEYEVGEAECSSGDVTALEIHWTSGNVKVETYDGDRIIITEDSDAEISEENQMRYRLKDGKLTVQFRKSQRMFGWVHVPAKDLLVRVPQDFEFDKVNMEVVSAETNIVALQAKEVKVETVSGKIDIADTVCDTFALEGVSGKINIEDIVTDVLTIETVSGKIDLSGSLQKANVETVSGNVTFDMDNAPESIACEGISGNITIDIPEELCTGFTLDFDGLSGNISSEFETTKKGSVYTHGDGSMDIIVSAVSGRVKINKK